MARKLEENPRVRYADASFRKHSDRAAVVVTSKQRLIVSTSLKATDPAVAEEAASDRIGELYNIIHWTSAEQNKFKASNGHRLKRRDDSTAANSGTVEEIQG
ncbi:hypothetical protein MTO96_049730 [Rhipicephalus appendiculatus]